MAFFRYTFSFKRYATTREITRVTGTQTPAIKRLFFRAVINLRLSKRAKKLSIPVHLIPLIPEIIFQFMKDRRIDVIKGNSMKVTNPNRAGIKKIYAAAASALFFVIIITFMPSIP